MLPQAQKNELRTELATLQSLLKGPVDAGDLDETTRESMQRVVEDIERLLQETKPDGWTQVKHDWNEALAEFESQHPGLTEAVSAITGVLANAGI